MRISDWSSDVCSSDLRRKGLHCHRHQRADARHGLQSLRYRRGGCEFLDPCGLRINPAIEYSNLIEHREAFLAHQSRQIAVGRLQDCADATDVLDALRDNVPELIQGRSEEHTSELQSLMRISYAVFCLKKKKKT